MGNHILVVAVGNLSVNSAVLFILFGLESRVFRLAVRKHKIRSCKAGRRRKHVYYRIIERNFAVIFKERHALIEAEYRGRIVVYRAAAVMFAAVVGDFLCACNFKALTVKIVKGHKRIAVIFFGVFLTLFEFCRKRQRRYGRYGRA